MQQHGITMILALAGLLMLFVLPVSAATTTQDEVLYQTTFATDPGWTTNSPHSYYWVPEKGVYHYSIEPGNGGNAYIQIPDYPGGSFTLEFDVTPTSTPDGTTFRLGFSTQQMDRTKGTIALSEFTNGKYGKIMSIRAVTPGNRLVEVTSQAFSYGKKTGVYPSQDTTSNAPTVNFVDNHTYHVTLKYDDPTTTLSMQVIDKTAISNLWGYYIDTTDPLRGMNYLVVGTVGDYSTPVGSADGYIDNVRLTIPVTVTVTSTPPTTAGTPVTMSTTPQALKTTIQQTAAAPASTTASPIPLIIPLAAAGIALLAVVSKKCR